MADNEALSAEEVVARRVEILRRFRGPVEENDEADRKRWAAMTMNERGAAMVDLLYLVDAIGNYPEKKEMFPGFLKLKRERDGA